jgi:hypothetical protein
VNAVMNLRVLEPRSWLPKLVVNVAYSFLMMIYFFSDYFTGEAICIFRNYYDILCTTDIYIG